jgi:hypothetical protein
MVGRRARRIAVWVLRALLIVVGVLCLLFLLLWMLFAPPVPFTKAPLSALSRVEPTANGLARLFEQECLQQRDRRWALRHVWQERLNCGAFDNGDCVQSTVGDARWDVRTTTGARIIVVMNWQAAINPDQTPQESPSGPVDCHLEAPDSLATELNAAFLRLRTHYTRPAVIAIQHEPYDTDVPADYDENTHRWRLYYNVIGR